MKFSWVMHKQFVNCTFLTYKTLLKSILLHVVGQSVCQLNEEISLSDLILMPTQNLIDVKKDDTTRSTKRRFSTPMSNVELNKKIPDAIPRKTRSNNAWAVGVWMAWTLKRNLYPETFFFSFQIFY